MNATAEQSNWQPICQKSDLVANSGVCALMTDAEGNEVQVAIFYLPKEEQPIYAVSNWDPIGKANVISRGILGDIGGKIVVASPLYKQHFDLSTGECLEDEEASLKVFELNLDGDQVLISL